MPFDIDAFKAQMSHTGTIKTNKFEVSMNLPEVFDGDEKYAFYSGLIQGQIMYCDRASIPGLFLQTMKFRRYGYGVLETKPITPTFNDVQLSFISDSGGDNWRFFHKWINKISNSDTSSGIWNGTTERSTNRPLFPYELGWYDEFVTPIAVSWYNEAGLEVKRIVLNNAYPTAISDIKLDWGDGGDVARFIVNFAILDWFSDEESAPR